MADIPKNIAEELQKQYPGALEHAREGAKAALNVESVKQALRLAVGEVLDSNGRPLGTEKVRKMLGDRQLADDLIKRHYGESGVRQQ